jgi:hypothetical protein
MKAALAVGTVGLLILPALVYTQVTGRVLNPRLRTTYPSLSAAVAAAAANDTLLVSGTLTGSNATLGSTDTPPDGLKIVAGRGLRGTLQPTSCPGAVLDVSGRLGSLLIQGLKLVVPDECVGIYSNANGNPLTVRGTLIQRATATADITGIFLEDETDGPFLIESNVIPSTGATSISPIINFGVIVDGDPPTPITATVRRNRIGSSPTFIGILVNDVPSGSSVIVERNIVDGGNDPGSVVGIEVVGSDGVIVRQNTVRRFVRTPASQDAAGIAIVESFNTQVLRNVIANNDVGVVVDDDCSGTCTGTDTADSVSINSNNITSTVANATGLLYVPDSGVASPGPLDATNNWWGAASGPNDIDNIPAGTDPDQCPEAAGPTCGTPQPAATDGTGLPVDSGAGVGFADCGIGAGQVTTCPFRTSPVSGAGA